MLVGFLTAEPQQELLILYFCDGPANAVFFLNRHVNDNICQPRISVRLFLLSGFSRSHFVALNFPKKIFIILSVLSK